MGGCCTKVGDVEDPSRKGSGSAPKQAASANVISKKVAQAATTRVLALRECGLKQLPPNATDPEFATLRTADLSSNHLKSLPEAVGSWTNLQNLLCGQNLLAELPATVGQMAGLQKLVLSANRLRRVPVELSQLGKLKTLLLDGNLLGEGLAMGTLPLDVFGGSLSGSLEELDLSGNSLEEVPDSVSNLAVLQRLILGSNRLKCLPAEFGKLARLQYLDVAENRLTFLPDGMLVDMVSLSELWLKGNPMDRLKLQEMAGFNGFLARRRERLDAKIEANVVGRVNLAVCGLE